MATRAFDPKYMKIGVLVMTKGASPDCRLSGDSYRNGSTLKLTAAQ